MTPKMETKIYLILLVFAYDVFNVGMIYFNYKFLFSQHNCLFHIANTISPINLVGIIVHSTMLIASMVFVYCRLTEKD